MLRLLSGLLLQEQQRNTELIWGLWCPLTFLSPFQTKKIILQLLWKHDFLYRRAWQTWQAERLSWHSAIFCDVASRRSGVLTAAGHDEPLSLKGHLPSTSPNHQLPAACWRTSRAADSRCQGGTRGVDTWRETESIKTNRKQESARGQTGLFPSWGPIRVSEQRTVCLLLTFCTNSSMFQVQD